MTGMTACALRRPMNDYTTEIPCKYVTIRSEVRFHEEIQFRAFIDANMFLMIDKTEVHVYAGYQSHSLMDAMPQTFIVVLPF